MPKINAADRQFLLDVHRELLEARHRGEHPAACVFLQFDGGKRRLCTTDPVAVPPSPDEGSGEVDLDALPAKRERGADDTDVPMRSVPSGSETTATDDAILDVLRTCDQPLKRESIARRARCKNNTHFFERLKNLCERSVVIRFTGHLYWLSERGEPAPE